MEGMSIAYSDDRRYDDASVTDTINFDAETINFDAETVDFDAPSVYPLPAEPPPSAFHEYEEEEFQQLNNRSGKLKYAAIGLFGLLAACALAITLSLLFGQGRASTVSSAQAGANPPSSNVVDVPTSQPNTMLRSYPPTIRGTDPKVTDGPTSTSSPTAINGTAAPSSATSGLDECSIDGACSEEGSTCAIDKETCCGVTYDSIKCECSGGQWLCMATDACNRPDSDCEETTSPTSNPSSSDLTQTDSPTITIQTPQAKPTPLPSKKPSVSPSFKPTPLTTNQPSSAPAPFPTASTSTSSPSNKPSRAPSPEPTPLPSKKPSLEPTTAQPSSRPTAEPTTSQPSSKPTASPTTIHPSYSPTAGSTTYQPSSKPTEVPTTSQPSPSPTASPKTVQPTQDGKKYCVNIKFTTDDFPGDNGFTFLSKGTGDVLYEQKTGSMSAAQTPYFSQICDLSAGNYELVVTDSGGDGLFLRGNGSYVVDIDGTVILVGGRFNNLNEISHDIIVGFNANMSDTDKGFLDAHNSRRKTFHESQNVSFRPMTWSEELAAGASAWAMERAKICNVTEVETGKYGQNIAIQRLNSPDDAHSPDKIVSWWAPKNTGGELPYNNQFTAMMWRAALYIGCAAEVAPIENSNQYCQVTNCRYVRTTNCAVNSANWLPSTLDENANLCSDYSARELMKMEISWKALVMPRKKFNVSCHVHIYLNITFSCK